MVRLRSIILVSLVAWSVLGKADDAAPGPGDGVLVLRNGSILQGRITPIDDSLIVTMGDGEVRLARSEVVLQCGSLDEAYLRQRDRLSSEDPSAHLALADWCLRHGLLSRAADQLLAAFVAEPGHPRLAHLERRLRVLTTAGPTAAPEPAVSLAVSPAPLTPATKLSPALVRQFTQMVQPILLNRCATYACHGAGTGSPYQLIRTASGHAPTSRMTQRNLQATYSYIDHGNPDNSPLLLRGQAAHGGAQLPPLSARDSQPLEILTSWVRSAAVRPIESIATDRGGPKPVMGTEHLPADHRIEPSVPAGGSPVVPADYVEPPAPAVPRFSPSSPSPSVPSDPFDPEIFNRRFHPDRGAGAGSEPAEPRGPAIR